MTWEELWKKLRNYKFDPFWDTVMIAAGILLPAAMCWYTGNWWPGYLQNLLLYVMGIMVAYWFIL